MEKKRIAGAKVVMFGDSITFGQWLPEEHKWINQITERFNLRSINAGIGGNTTTEGLQRLQTDVLVHVPDFVTINFAMNDHVMTAKDSPKVSKSAFASNLMKMIEMIRDHHAIPILITTNYLIEGDANHYYYRRHPQSYYINVGGAEAWLKQYIQIVREVAALKGTDLIDVYEACARYDKYEFLRSLRNEARSDDGVHPAILGSQVYAQEIGDYLAVAYA